MLSPCDVALEKIFGGPCPRHTMNCHRKSLQIHAFTIQCHVTENLCRSMLLPYNVMSEKILCRPMLSPHDVMTEITFAGPCSCHDVMWDKTSRIIDGFQSTLRNIFLVVARGQEIMNWDQATICLIDAKEGKKSWTVINLLHMCVIQEGYIVSAKSSAEPLRRDKLTDTLVFHNGCLVQYPDLAACGHNPPLVVLGLCARCPLHSSRDSSYELGIFPHCFPCHASDDQGKAISRPLAADTWQEQQQTCSSGRSSIHLFSQNIIESHLFFSCIGLLHHSSHLLHFSILWNGVPNQDCGTHTQQRARCYQHSQASGRRRFSNLSGRYHLLWKICAMFLFTLCRVYRSNHSCSHE